MAVEFYHDNDSYGSGQKLRITKSGFFDIDDNRRESLVASENRRKSTKRSAAVKDKVN